MLDDVKTLLMRAAAKTNDSSEEKHVTEFLFDIISDDMHPDDEDKNNLIRSSALQMKDFCDLVIEATDK